MAQPPEPVNKEGEVDVGGGEQASGDAPDFREQVVADREVH